MSSYDRQSPRAAIKDWLSRVATSPETSQLASKDDQATEHACSKQSPSNRKRKKSMKDTLMHGQNIPHMAIGQGATAMHQDMSEHYATTSPLNYL